MAIKNSQLSVVKNIESQEPDGSQIVQAAQKLKKARWNNFLLELLKK